MMVMLSFKLYHRLYEILILLILLIRNFLTNRSNGVIHKIGAELGDRKHYSAPVL